jgi:hypothetical protein
MAASQIQDGCREVCKSVNSYIGQWNRCLGRINTNHSASISADGATRRSWHTISAMSMWCRIQPNIWEVLVLKHWCWEEICIKKPRVPVFPSWWSTLAHKTSIGPGLGAEFQWTQQVTTLWALHPTETAFYWYQKDLWRASCGFFLFFFFLFLFTFFLLHTSVLV